MTASTLARRPATHLQVLRRRAAHITLGIGPGAHRLGAGSGGGVGIQKEGGHSAAPTLRRGRQLRRARRLRPSPWTRRGCCRQGDLLQKSPGLSNQWVAGIGRARASQLAARPHQRRGIHAVGQVYARTRKSGVTTHNVNSSIDEQVPLTEKRSQQEDKNWTRHDHRVPTGIPLALQAIQRLTVK
jgi:hypothetical protein